MRESELQIMIADYRTPEYSIWLQMRQRCNNPNCKVYRLYGKRGIRVCKRWDSYKNFIKDMGKRPSKKYSIDRIDANGNYEPENCRWSMQKTQVKNRRCYNKFGHAGIRKKGNTFQARITDNYKEIYLGSFRTLEDAIKARKEAEKIYE